MDMTAPDTNGLNFRDNIHFLNRVGYGPSAETSAEIEAVGWRSVLYRQLHPENIDTSELDATLAAQFPTLKLTAKELLAADDQALTAELIPEFITSSVMRQLYSPAQLYERMVEFWSDHFNINILDDQINYFKATHDRDDIRPHAMGSFRQLLHASARSPAMLLYLDNYSNTREGPNENYARELLELHTLGVDGGYTEDDVVEVARAFTGWTIANDTLEFTFNSSNHDFGSKIVMGQKITSTLNSGMSEGEQVLDLLASHPSTARFISLKLIRRFISDAPHPQLLDKMTQLFLDTDGDIKALLNMLFGSGAFWSSREKKMKRPLDFILSLIRRFNIPPSEDLVFYIGSRLKGMGQTPFTWHAPDGFPDTAEYWTNTAALVSRWSTGKDAAYFLTSEKYEEMLEGATTPSSIIQAMSLALLDRGLPLDERRALRVQVFSSLGPYETVEGDPVNYARVLATVLLGSRYFQMR